MENPLTHGLVAGALMALMNPLLGLEPVSWSSFAAGILAMILASDSGHGITGRGTPLGGSVVSALLVSYLGCAFGYLTWAFGLADAGIASAAALVAAVGAWASLMARLLTGGMIFTVPNWLRPGARARDAGLADTSLWSAWGRLELGGRLPGCSRVNITACAVILAAIWLL